MKTNLRGLLATMFATGMLAACSSDGNTPPTGTDAGTGTDIGAADTGGGGDVPRTDVPRTDVPRADVPMVNPCTTAMDISSMTPGADGAIRVMGDNTDAPGVQVGDLGLASEGGCLGVTSGGDGAKGGAVVYRYTMRTAGVLTASTANPGTDEFDTVVAILGTCSANARPLACNDDIGQGNLLSTARTTAPLMMGQTVFIVVGGWGANSKNAATGAYVLSVREAAPIAIGMPCPQGQVCAAGSLCVGATAMNSGVCTADGTAPGAACRTAAPFCDGAFSCSVATPSMAARGICRRSAAPGEACGPTATCSMMGFCPNLATTPAVAGDAGVSADAGAPVTARYCTLPTMEAEPNNTPAAPQAAVTRTTIFRGAITPGTDRDCFAVTVPAGATLFAETTDAQGTCDLGDGEDTVINIYRDGTAAPIATNDDISMDVLCSRLDGRTNPALLRVSAGTYTVCVSPYTEMGETEGTPIPAYYLTVGVIPPAP
jgi:hypothetical protein